MSTTWDPAAYLVFDDHRHVLQALREVGRELVEGAPDVLLEVEH